MFLTSSEKSGVPGFPMGMAGYHKSSCGFRSRGQSSNPLPLHILFKFGLFCLSNGTNAVRLVRTKLDIGHESDC